MARNGSIAIPDLDSSLDKLVKAEKSIRRSVPYHHDIYDPAHTAVEKYNEREEKKEGTGNNNDLRRSLYFGVYNSIIALLHDKRSEEKGGLEQFRKDTVNPQHRKTMEERLAYVDSLVLAAAASTDDLKRVGFERSDVAKWKSALKLISAACKYYSQPGVKRTGPQVNGRLETAYKSLEELKQTAIDNYDDKIER